MKQRGALIGLLVILGTAAAAGAQIVSSFHIIPVVAKAPGVGDSVWQSDLSMSNVSDLEVEVQVGFFPAGTDNSFDLMDPANPFEHMHTVTLLAGASQRIEDVLGTWFEEDNSKGFLVILASPSSHGGEGEPLLAVSSRTYNIGDPQGTFGQGVASSLLGIAFGRGTSVLPGVRQDSSFRSNIGVVNLSPDATTFLVTLYDSSGSQAAQATKSIPAFSLDQWSLTSLGVSTLPGGRAEVTIDPATITWDPCGGYPIPGFSVGIFMAYLSKVDAGTDDAEFTLGQVDWTEYVVECGEEPPLAEDCCPCP